MNGHIARHNPHHARRDNPWHSIDAQGCGGSTLQFTGETNSDFHKGQLKPDAPAQQLYHLTEDPRQTKNVIRNHPDIAQLMAERLAEMQSRKGGL